MKALMVAALLVFFGPASAMAQTGLATLRVVGVKPNDVLKVREYPTTTSRVVGSLPFDATQVTTTGEEQGPWIFVRYENIEGWVNRAFVIPDVRRGRRLD